VPGRIGDSEAGHVCQSLYIALTLSQQLQQIQPVGMAQCFRYLRELLE
jgi:hypothetical protein